MENLFKTNIPKGHCLCLSVRPSLFLSLYLSQRALWFLFNRFQQGKYLSFVANFVLPSLVTAPRKMSMSMPMPMPTPPDSMYNNSKDMTMHMSFFWGKDVIVLFPGWPGDRLGMYILAIIFVFIMGFVVEILSIFPSFKLGSPLITNLIQAAAYAIRMALAYMVMLSVMSFNIGIFIAAVVGHAFGRFFVKYKSFTVASPT